VTEPRPLRGRARRVGAALAVAALAGCASGPAPDPDPVPTVTSALVLDGADQVRANGRAVAVGDVVLHVRTGPGAEVTTADADDGTVRLTADVAGTVPGVTRASALDLAVPAGWTLDVLDDASAVVRDPGGVAVAAVTVPLLTAADTAAAARVQVRAADAASASWTVSVTAPVRTDGTVLDAAVPPAGLSVTLAPGALADARWRDLDDEGGRSLAVVPAPWARSGGLAAEELLWAELVTAVPEADAPGVRDQLTCHVIGAPDKASWNLEPWRPAVGLLETLAARCNPS
jgi:hypothetical protein